jgi:hypothetical protein
MNPNYPPCPKCGGRHYKVWKLTHPIVFHYVLNPGIAINEILLGQCLPKVTLLCQTCQLPLYARSYVPCPHCRAMHDARLWSKQKAFGNWRGFICLSCGKAIPRLWNLVFNHELIGSIISGVAFGTFMYIFCNKKPK